MKIEAWRVWRLDTSERVLLDHDATAVRGIDEDVPADVPVERDRTPRLRSVSQDYVWEGPVVHATARPHVYHAHHDFALAASPTSNCPGCHGGFYAFKHAICLDDFPEEDLVIGCVQLYGHIVVHEFGYRAEHAVIRQLLVGAHVPAQVRDGLARRYACDVDVLPELTNHQRHGRLIPTTQTRMCPTCGAWYVGAHRCPAAIPARPLLTPTPPPQLYTPSLAPGDVVTIAGLGTFTLNRVREPWWRRLWAWLCR